MWYMLLVIDIIRRQHRSSFVPFKVLYFHFFVICQELLTRNKTASAEFLEAHYDKFFSHYQNLLNSDNYVTRRQALKVSQVIHFFSVTFVDTKIVFHV